MNPNDLISPDGEYVNWRDAIEDLYTIINAKNALLIDLANRMTDAINMFKNSKVEWENRMSAFEKELQNIRQDINALYGDL